MWQRDPNLKLSPGEADVVRRSLHTSWTCVNCTALSTMAPQTLQPRFHNFVAAYLYLDLYSRLGSPSGCINTRWWNGRSIQLPRVTPLHHLTSTTPPLKHTMDSYTSIIRAFIEASVTPSLQEDETVVPVDEDGAGGTGPVCVIAWIVCWFSTRWAITNAYLPAI